MNKPSYITAPMNWGWVKTGFKPVT